MALTLAVSACRFTTLRSAFLVLGIALTTPLTRAESYALLVGVNEVSTLPARLRLRGPANDVALMRQVLIGRGFAPQNITVLAQRSPIATAAPTHAEVSQAMGRIVQAVRKGDTVVLHLAGHGVQVPQMLPARDGAAREPDGLDEVFLLQDSGTWDLTHGELPRSLYDDDIGTWMDSLVDRGVHVFAVFDSCHAAGLARGGGAFALWRSVAGAELGVPAWRPSASSVAGPSLARRPPRTDGRVLAYAARGHELAGEEWLPKGGALALTRMQGVFSFEVAGALMAGARTVGDLSASLRERYAAAKRVSPSPVIAGDGGLLAP